MTPIKTYTLQSERFSVIKEWTPNNAIYCVVANDLNNIEQKVSPDYATEKEALAWIIGRLENKVTLISNRLFACQDLLKRKEGRN